jgi:hypothetical protein
VPVAVPKKTPNYGRDGKYTSHVETSESWFSQNWPYLAGFILCILVPLLWIGTTEGCKHIRHLSETRAQQLDIQFNELVQKYDRLVRDKAMAPTKPELEDKFRNLAKEFLGIRGKHGDAAREKANECEEQAHAIKIAREDQERQAQEAQEAQERDREEQKRQEQEREQAERERKEQELIDNVKNLPSVWGVLSVPLENSAFLYEHRERVKIEYEPFFDRGAEPDVVVVPAENSVILNAWGRKIRSIELTEKGLEFKSHPPSDAIQSEALGRVETLILLSKLRIAIDDNPEHERKIDLWNPYDSLNTFMEIVNAVFRNSDMITVDYSDGLPSVSTPWGRFIGSRPEDFEKVQRIYIERPEGTLLLMEAK